MTTNSPGDVFKRFFSAQDPAGDQQFANKLRDRALVLSAGHDVTTALPWSELTPEEQAFISVLKIPRKFRDLENCGALPPERCIATLRALHAAELVEATDLDKARALVPIELRKAIAAAKGQDVKVKKLVANVYRPTLDGEDAPPPPAARTPPPAPVPVPSPAESKPAASASPERIAQSAELAELEKQVGEMHHVVLGMDHFKVLNVSRAASDADVKNAYLAAVKKWHPDRLSGMSGDAVSEMQTMLGAVFAAVGDAYRTLQEKSSREAYLKDLVKRESSGTASGARPRPPRADEAKLQASKGKVFMSKKDFDEAERYYKRAAECDPDIHEYKVEQAWAHSLNPKVPEDKRRKEAIDMLVALTLVSKYGDAFFKLGLLYRVIGDNRGAEQAIRKAHQLDPRHAEANKEVRVLDMRADKARQAAESSSAKTSGLFDKLKKLGG